MKMYFDEMIYFTLNSSNVSIFPADISNKVFKTLCETANDDFPMT